MAKHYIDRDALVENLELLAKHEESFRQSVILGVVHTIKARSTIDAVKVVRCKDCKHYRPQKKSAHWENRANYCNRIVTIKTQPYDFCSYGERKDGDGNG